LEKVFKLNHYAHDHDDHPDPHLKREEECKYDPHLSLELGMIIKKIIKFKDIPLSNIDLRKWCDYLRIPIKGIFSRNGTKHPVPFPMHYQLG